MGRRESFIYLKLHHQLGLKPVSCKLSLVFKWRSREERAHYSRVSREALGVTQMDLSVIRKKITTAGYIISCTHHCPLPGPSRKKQTTYKQSRDQLHFLEMKWDIASTKPGGPIPYRKIFCCLSRVHMDPRNCRFELVYQKAISQVENMSFTTRSKEHVSQSEKIQVNSHYDQSSFWQMWSTLQVK